jgi:transcription elongation factor Elf1
MHPMFRKMFKKLLEQKWTCPKCNKEQVVLVKDKSEPMVCKFCGAETPPSK